MLQSEMWIPTILIAKHDKLPYLETHHNSNVSKSFNNQLLSSID